MFYFKLLAGKSEDAVETVNTSANVVQPTSDHANAGKLNSNSSDQNSEQVVSENSIAYSNQINQSLNQPASNSQQLKSVSHNYVPQNVYFVCV